MQTILRRRLLLGCFVIAGTFVGHSQFGRAADTAPQAVAASTLKLTLPPQCYAVVGQEFRIDYGNLVDRDTNDDPSPDGVLFH